MGGLQAGALLPRSALVSDGEIHVPQNMLDLLSQSSMVIRFGILADGDQSGSQPGVVHRRDKMIVTNVFSDHWRGRRDPVPLIKHALFVGVGTVRLLLLSAGLSGAKLVQDGNDLRLYLGPGTQQIVGRRP